MDITFTETVKEEICQLEYQPHCMKALLLAFIRNNMAISMRNNDLHWELKTQSGHIIRLLKKIMTT